MNGYVCATINVIFIVINYSTTKKNKNIERLNKSD